jgi:hypothetical protein
MKGTSVLIAVAMWAVLWAVSVNAGTVERGRIATSGAPSFLGAVGQPSGWNEGRGGYNVKMFGAVGDGPHQSARASHPVSGWCSNHGGTRYTVTTDAKCLTAIRQDYHEVTSLTNEIDWAAVNAAIDASKTRGSFGGTILLPNSKGCYTFDQPLQNGNGVILKGEGSPGTCITYYGSDYAIHTPANINSYTVQDIDIYVANVAGGGIKVGDDYRHVLIKQVNIILPSGSRGYGESNDDRGTHGGIDVMNEMVRVTGGYIGFHSEGRSSSNQWLCIDCYADSARHIGFALQSGINQTICIQCAADNSGGYGFDLHPAFDNFVHLIGTTCEHAILSCYLIEGQGGAVTLEQPATYEDFGVPYDVANASGVDVTLIQPASVSTAGVTSAQCTSAKSLTIIGNTEFDKLPATSWTACLAPTMQGALQSSAYVSRGDRFTSNKGCSETSLVGGPTVGYFLAGSDDCTTTIRMGGFVRAPHGWVCSVWDLTTKADTLREIDFTTTTVTITGNLRRGDRVAFTCQGF